MRLPDGEGFGQIFAAFRFVVQVKGIDLGAFTECTLPVVEWDMLEVKEGGLNNYVHQLPSQRKQARFTLKNGVGLNLLWFWCASTMMGKFVRQTVTIRLLSPLLLPIGAWVVHDAYPIKWTGPQLQADSTAVAIQSVEFACGEVVIEPADPAMFERLLNFVP